MHCQVQICSLLACSPGWAQQAGWSCSYCGHTLEGSSAAAGATEGQPGATVTLTYIRNLQSWQLSCCFCLSFVSWLLHSSSCRWTPNYKSLSCPVLSEVNKPMVRWSDDVQHRCMWHCRLLHVLYIRKSS